jgi:putative nucleotidyltransferase with HDIG domain
METLDRECVITNLLDTSEPFIIHGKRVGKLACAIAQEMNYREEQIELIFQAAALHDIGKSEIPGEIIYKPGRLIGEELTEIRRHPELGHCILMQMLRSESIITEVAIQHHERLDGSGYPFGLRGYTIASVTRIVSVADVIDTMIFPQVYRPALNLQQALQEIKQNNGSLYDPEVVAVTLSLFDRGILAAQAR